MTFLEELRSKVIEEAGYYQDVVELKDAEELAGKLDAILEMCKKAKIHPGFLPIYKVEEVLSHG